MVTRCDRNGLQILTHAIGDRGIRLTLDGYEAAAKANAAVVREMFNRGMASLTGDKTPLDAWRRG